MTNPSCKRRRFGRSLSASLAVSALALLAAAPQAIAQPAPPRGGPVIKTPATGTTPPRPTIGGGAGAKAGGAAGGAAGGSNAPGGAGKAGGGATGGAAGAPAAPGAAGAPVDDPMANVKQGIKEIEFRPKNAGALVSFNLDDADLPELVKAISNITGRRFIYGGKLRQIKATVYSPEKVTVGEAYSAFLSILETNGMTLIPHGRFMKIVETPGVVTQTTPVVGTATPVPYEDRYVTRLYRVANVDANEVSTMLQKFKSKDGDITVYPPGNLLVITDTGSNIQRMLRIVEEVDVGGAGDQLWVEPIHYASAEEVANKLNEILDLKGGGAGGKAGAAGGGKGGARIIPDNRTNSLIVTSTSPDYARLLELIKRIDVPQSGEGEVHVLPLQHAGCKELSGTLNSILGSSGGAGGGGGTRGGARASAPPVVGSTDDIFEGQVKVTCDEASNKLVITSSRRDYAQLRNVIDELDMARRQVFIEAVIMDVSVKRTLNLGIGYHAGAPVGEGLLFGGNNPKQSLLGLPANMEALALGLRGPDVTVASDLVGVSIPAFGVVLHALAEDGDANILATPHILATDNIPAEISVGENIPLQTNAGGLGNLASLAGAGAGGLGNMAGLLGGLGGLGGGFGAPRQDVGTRIKVTPHVNDSDQVRLELVEEISNQGASLGGDLGAISIEKRTASTTLIVRDQQTVVIGGLVRDAVTNAEKKIPILGDIPVLGALFRQTVKTTSKSNLLLILTPYVIRDQDDLRIIFERKMQERQEFLDRYFVFDERRGWEPPVDYGRSNGLVEDIRQSILQQDERARLEEEARPKKPLTHEMGEPIALPTLAGKASGSAVGGGAVGTAVRVGGDDDAPAAPANTQARPTRPRLNNPGAGGRAVERTE